MTFIQNTQRFFHAAFNSENQSAAEKTVNIFFSSLLLSNVIALIISTMEVFSSYESYFLYFEILSIFFFSLEYTLRLWTSPLHHDFVSRTKFVFSPLMIFDALVIIPHILSILFPGIFDTRILRLIRAFRIFRFKHYSPSLERMFIIIHRNRNELISAFSLVFMGVIVASTFMYFAEKDLQPENLGSIPAALYWGFITVSTVGYGDITPMSDLGRFISVITTLFGVSIYALPASILGAAFYAELRSKEARVIGMLERKVTRMEELMKKLTDENNRLKNEKIVAERENGVHQEKNIHKPFRRFWKNWINK